MSDRPPIGLLRGKGFDLGPLATRYPTQERTLLRLLADQAADRPDKTWLVFDGTDALTFQRAHQLTNRVARAVARDAGEGAHVGLFLRNQLEFMPAFFGAMANHGVAIPLNADARGPLLEYVVDWSDATIVIARAELLDRLVGLDSLGKVERVVAVGEGDHPASIHGAPVTTWERWLDGVPDTPPERYPAYTDACLIQFTSGTTGRPKGAVYPHQFLYLYSAMYSDSIGIHEDDVLSTPMPLFHVAALHLIANTALHAGATAHLKSRFSASRYWEEVADDGATFSIILGPMAALVMKATEEAPAHTLERIFCVPPPPELDEFERRFRTKIIWHAYGMTEISPLGMRPDVIPDAPRDTLGWPVSWMDFGVVDDNDEMLGPGEIGEIVFRPRLPHVMVREYYKNPEATVRAFRNYMFHTGDLGYYDEKGLLHYKGRKQERIRRRGENVSAPELEFVVLRHPDVMECAAYGVPSELGEEDVKLDVVLRRDLNLVDLHAWLAENLPRFMVPRYLERRDSFPKTPSERVQKYKLKTEPVDRPEVLDFQRRS